MAKKMLLVVALVVMSILVVGCQTVAGLGGDIKWTAEATADLMENQ